MTPDPAITLAWLALAHLVTDFVIQTNWIATQKFGFGRRAWQALGMHWLGSAACLLPFVVAFGAPGFAALIMISGSHAAIDRVKIVWTMRAEARSRAETRARDQSAAPPGSGATAWSPLPGLLFLVDQLAHVIVTLAAWSLFLASAPVSDGFSSAARNATGWADPTTAHRAILTAVVLLDLVIVNVRAASLFLATLVRWRPLAADIDQAAAAGSAGAHVQPGRSPSRQMSGAIGALERLLIVGLVLANATLAVGLVVAAKAIATLRRPADRPFPEHELLGAFASVSVAFGSALVAAAALAPSVLP